jgi:cytoskeletal protein CcmA (bactofilin family)
MPIISSNVSEASVLGPTARFKGKLRADEDLHIHGHVEGSIMHTKYLTISLDGHVKADISGHIIVVEGTVEGDIMADTSVAVTQSGHMKGDIRAPSISINDGADIRGKVAMAAARPSGSKAQPEPRAQTAGVTEAASTLKGK